MPFHFTNIELIVAAVVLVVIVLIAVAAYLQHRKAKTAAIRKRFESEYDRAVLENGSSRNAEAGLADRETRVAHAIAVRPGLADASPEELRAAMIQYRSIFDELVQAQMPQQKKPAA